MAWRETVKERAKEGGKAFYKNAKNFQKRNSASRYGSSNFGYGKYGDDNKYKKSRVPRIIGNIGRTAGDTALMTTGAWSHMTYRMRGLIAFVIVVAVLFIPFGIFQYAGWSMYLVVTWVINGFYWFVATIINAILNIFISSIDTIFSFVTEQVGGTYKPLEDWTLTTGTLLNPDSFKPTSFDNRYLLQWIWDSFGGTIKDMFNFVKK